MVRTSSSEGCDSIREMVIVDQNIRQGNVIVDELVTVTIILVLI